MISLSIFILFLFCVTMDGLGNTANVSSLSHI
jgi:hypothetical protein